MKIGNGLIHKLLPGKKADATLVVKAEVGLEIEKDDVAEAAAEIDIEIKIEGGTAAGIGIRTMTKVEREVVVGAQGVRVGAVTAVALLPVETVLHC